MKMIPLITTCNTSKLFILVLCLLVFDGVGSADVYKYKDADGHWQFSDTPKKGSVATAHRSYKSAAALNAPKNFITLLSKKYHPQNPIQKATLAVVTVKTELGSGSGFFVSKDCYLITNKHVVRPAKGKQWDSTQAKIQQNASSFQRTRSQIADEKERLSINKEKLDQFRDYMNGLSSGKERDVAEREYALHEQRYLQDKRHIETVSERFSEDEGKFLQQQSDFNFSSSVANVAQSFDITLKDNTTARANLVKVSSSEDLALLKINACQSPFLTLHPTGVLSQGIDVYAVGSPLGLRDQLTKGTITNVSSNGIATDAQILPGNSGGPLITSDGLVVGVNTVKVANESALNTGFGIAIPASQITKNFASYLR
ncbi:MAG: trypsin-like peptidase domain-containing protein [Cycloclasticus sp.]|nr:trypsin-like peptidase domain-containing protein [Cycloclasticus sp.]